MKLAASFTKKSLVCELLVILIMSVCCKTGRSFFLKNPSYHSFFLALREWLWGWWWDSGSVQGLGSESSFRPSLTQKRGGPGMEGGGSFYLDSKPMACVRGSRREREGVRVLTVKWWAVLVHRWATAGRVRVAGSLPALARLLPVCPPRPASQLTSKSSRSLSLSLPPSFFVISLEMTPHANGIQF